jgi:hypothetical protein
MNANQMYEAYESCFQFNCGSRHAVRRLRAERARACMEALSQRGDTPPPTAREARVRTIVMPSGKTMTVETRD